MLILLMMNTRYPFRYLPILAGILYCHIIVSAQSFSAASGILPTVATACASCPNQDFYNPPTTSSATTRAAFAQAATEVPTPTDGIIKVEDPAFKYYRVFDAKGELWIGGPVPKTRTIDLAYLPDGVYYLHLLAKDSETVRKMLKRE